MKKIIIFISLLLSIFIFGCSSPSQENQDQEFTLTYDANGADSGIVPSPTVISAVNLLLASNNGHLIKNGYGFGGWNTAPDGTGTYYYPGESYYLNKDATLYVYWVTPFITKWQTTTSNEAIGFYCYSKDNYYIDWGDGEVDWGSDSSTETHTYASAGLYTVSIYGYFPFIYFLPTGSVTPEALVDLVAWGGTKWRKMSYTFAGCTNLELSASDIPDLSLVTSMEYMFASASSFNQNISNWDVSNITNMHGVFSRATSFNQDISNWDVSCVTNMKSMFYEATAFSNHDLSSWDVDYSDDDRTEAIIHDSFSSGWGVGNIEPNWIP